MSNLQKTMNSFTSELVLAGCVFLCVGSIFCIAAILVSGVGSSSLSTATLLWIVGILIDFIGVVLFSISNHIKSLLKQNEPETTNDTAYQNA